MKNIIKKILRESEFDWVDDVEPSPNYQGHPQGVVYLRNHDEIDEFLTLIKSYNGDVDLSDYSRDYHEALEDVRDRFESDDWGGYDDWVPTISTSFFMDKEDPTKYTTGYWDYDVEEDAVTDWLDDGDGGCEYVMDCVNWKIYTDISQLRSLLSGKLTESNEFDWTDEVDVTWSTYYNEIYRDVSSLPSRIDDIHMDTLMSIYYKLDVLTREIKNGSKLRDTSIVDEIYWDVRYIIDMVNGVKMKHQAQYNKTKDHILGDIRELIRHLQLVSESHPKH